LFHTEVGTDWSTVHCMSVRCRDSFICDQDVFCVV